jgi:general secretion pathway protein G
VRGRFQMTKSKVQNKGFTLIELLIVIVLLGILAVAVLSAINPIEQIKKARDSGRKSDAAELLNAYERYFTTFGWYPWETTATEDHSLGPSGADDTSAVGIDYLITNNELKSQFASRRSVANGELCVYSSSDGFVSVCFVPESTNGRRGGLGTIVDSQNSGTTTCGTSYVSNCASGDCFVCVPQ